MNDTENLRAERENAELVSRVLDEPAKGLALFHDRFAREINRLVYRMLGPDGEHEDIVQVAFLTMIESIGKVRDPSRLNFWVRSVCMNVVRSELRKRTVRRAFLLKTPTVDVGDFASDVESLEFLKHSRRVLDRFSPEERIVFVLHYVEEYSLPEIAEICNFSTITAKRRLAKAREKFRKHMTQDTSLARLESRRELHK